ncbi:hypothetical protein AKJ64_01090 [candidate division MSBL1 archaeon SCGC-AAA259E17]|uniref:Uncharacterized protein n=1 Tax=candidate division MSBL1 archaeon SCGC-AAA259E17 TaxID=1698263 RepID=A0A133UGD7_9EURY|nr:hypothetical protein AKJ64_01090 [candidate division MSBL1 archaeon SCGC-AAA259E17]
MVVTFEFSREVLKDDPPSNGFQPKTPVKKEKKSNSSSSLAPPLGEIQPIYRISIWRSATMGTRGRDLILE